MKYLLVISALTLYSCSPNQGEVKKSTPTPSPTTNSLVEQVVEEPLSCNNKKFSDDDLNLAALRVIQSRVGYETPRDEHALAARIKRLEKVKQFASTLDNTRIKMAYEKWIDFFEKEDIDAAEDIKKVRAGQMPDSDEVQRKRAEDAKWQRAADLSKCLPVPK